VVNDDDRRKRIEDLMSQDPQITDDKMKEFRMQLEQSLADWERRRARLWRIICISACLYLGVIVFAMLVLNGAPAGSIRGMLTLPWFIVGLLTMIVGGYATILYVGKYMPAIRKLHYDIQTAMIAELQEQFLTLREELRARNSRNE
jgi:hypothetical protein